MTSVRLVGLSSGSEPIFEKRSLMSCRRCTSLSNSGMSSSSGYCSFSISTHAIRLLMGVPSWWAVSLDKPTHTLFCSARFDDNSAKMATTTKMSTTPN